MKSVIHGHRFGDRVVPSETLDDVRQALASNRIRIARGASSKIKGAVLAELRSRGWSADLALHPNSRITITSIKGQVGLCFQTGNMGRMYADLLKLQALYLRGDITSGILIVPTAPCAQVLGSNIANYERLVGELAIFEHVISAPIVVVGIE
jgi:hypothetical protein